MNPLAKFVAAILIACALILTLNPYIAGGLLLCELAFLPLLKLTPRRLARIAVPILVAAGLAGLTTSLYGRASGALYWAWGPVFVTDGSLYLGAAIAVRVLAIGLPGVALFATVDPTDLADSLAQLWKLPQRFVFGALAAVRLVDVLVDDWQTISLARRARGLGSGRGPFAALARAFSQVFALLVSSLRRGTTLAIAMDARAFGASLTRSYARQAVWRVRDWVFVVSATVVAGVVVTLSIVFGSGITGVA